MKALTTFLLVLSAGLAFGQKALPSVELKTFDGQAVDLSDYAEEGRPVIISFWATWCKPCILELNTIAEVYEDWQEEYGVKLIAVSIDDTRSVAKAKMVIESYQWPYELLLDTNRDCLRALGFQAPPQTYLVDGAGQIVYSHSGFSPGAELELEEQLEILKRK